MMPPARPLLLLVALSCSSSWGALSFRPISSPSFASSSSSSSSSSFASSSSCTSTRGAARAAHRRHTILFDADPGIEKGCDDCLPPSSSADADGGPILLQPYLPALDPKYPVRGPVGNAGGFVLSRSGPPTIEELSNDNMLRIVKSTCSDLEVNTLVWKCLGYRYKSDDEVWDNAGVFPKWKESHPIPPDFVGMRRVYTRDVDRPCLEANQALVRSIPMEHKQSLKTHLKPLGWGGYQYRELTPNMTRRAQCANWLIFYREELFGYTIEELTERRQLRREAEMAAAEAKKREEGRDDGREEAEEWKPPVKEVY